MKAKISAIIMVVVVLIGMSEVQAIDVDFYSDAKIEDGDVYTNVFVYDTPPDTTTLDMYGGSVAGFVTYDSSIVNIYGGEVWWGLATYNLSTVNIYGGSVKCEGLIVGHSSTLNVYGGSLLVGNSPVFDPASTVNIYGYGFNYDGFQLTGFLTDGSSLIIREVSYSDYAHMNLIPEPTTFLLFGFGVLLLRKRKSF